MFTEPERLQDILKIAAGLSGMGVITASLLGFIVTKFIRLMFGRV